MSRGVSGRASEEWYTAPPSPLPRVLRGCSRADGETYGGTGRAAGSENTGAGEHFDLKDELRESRAAPRGVRSRGGREVGTRELHHRNSQRDREGSRRVELVIRKVITWRSTYTRPASTFRGLRGHQLQN